MTFRVGQKVVCINGYDDLAKRYGCRGPVKGNVYTIREFDDRGSEPALRLVEITNPLKMHRNISEPIEPAFAVAAFRPVVERKTDIGFAHEILRKASKPARGPAVTSPHQGATNG
jgi:hypothetical protein